MTNSTRYDDQDPTLILDESGNLRPKRFINDHLVKQLDKVGDDQLPVIEVFYTVEGEGSHIGVPRVLARISLCPVSCSWCDTIHSWPVSGGEIKGVDDFIAEIDLLARGRVREVSITGGEPMMYPRQMKKVATTLRQLGYFTSVETSGIVLNQEVFNCFDAVSMDIKTPSSRVKVTESYLEKYRELRDKTTNIQFKCVVCNKQDLEWIEHNLQDFLHLSPRMVPLIITPGVQSTIKSTKKGNLAKELNDIVSMILEWNKGYSIRILAQQHSLLAYR